MQLNSGLYTCTWYYFLKINLKTLSLQAGTDFRAKGTVGCSSMHSLVYHRLCFFHDYPYNCPKSLVLFKRNIRTCTNSQGHKNSYSWREWWSIRSLILSPLSTWAKSRCLGKNMITGQAPISTCPAQPPASCGSGTSWTRQSINLHK